MGIQWMETVPYTEIQIVTKYHYYYEFHSVGM